MALGKKRLGAVKSSSSNSNPNLVGDGTGLGLGLEFVKYKRGFGRKRVSSSGGKICGESLKKTQELEALPQDILVKIICCVEHDDLKQLFDVSKTIREAALLAKKWHFEYTTPRKTLFFRDKIDSMTDIVDETEAPFLKKYRRSRIICENKFSKISMALFK